MNKLIKHMMCGLMVLLFAASAFAGVDYTPWYKGQPNTVNVVYDYNPNTEQWDRTFTTVYGGYPLYVPSDNAEGLLTVNTSDVDATKCSVAIPNFVDNLPIKYMRLQLVFTDVVDSADITLDGMWTKPEDTIWGEVDRSQGEDYVHFIDITIEPNPDWEWLAFTWYHPTSGGPVADGQTLGPELVKVVVDTISIPEPATIGILALGGLTLIRRRRFV